MVSSIIRQDTRHLITLTLPILLTQICQSGLSFVDTIMAGQVSALDLSGVAIGAGIWMPVMLLAVGILLATTPLIGEAIGQQARQNIAYITQQSLWLSLFIGLFGFFIANQMHYLFDWMRVPANIQPIATNFLFGISFGYPAICAYTTLRCYTESLQHPSVVTVISLLGLFLNIPLNYTFIHGLTWSGHTLLPALGGAGCGYASAVTLWLNLIMLAGYLSLSHRYDFRQTRFYVNFGLPNLTQLLKQIKIGLPIGMAVFFEVSAFSLASLIISPLGEIAVASHQLTITLSSQLFMFPFSIAMALTIMVSNRYGAKDYPALQRIKVIGIILATSIALISMLLIAVFREVLPTIFTHDPVVIAQATTLLWFALLYQLFDAWQVNFAGILRGLQDTNVPMLITLVCYWIVALPLGFYLTRYTPMGARGFWLALVTALALASVLLGARVWQQQKVLQQRWR